MTIDQDYVREGARKMTDKDIEKVVDKLEDVKAKFVANRPLRRYIDDVKLLGSMLKDYWKKNYRDVPYGTIGAIAFTLIYVLNPFDLVPDVLPIIGQLDDAAVFTACLLLIERDLRVYEEWKAAQPQSMLEG